MPDFSAFSDPDFQVANFGGVTGNQGGEVDAGGAAGIAGLPASTSGNGRAIQDVLGALGLAIGDTTQEEADTTVFGFQDVGIDPTGEQETQLILKLLFGSFAPYIQQLFAKGKVNDNFSGDIGAADLSALFPGSESGIGAIGAQPIGFEGPGVTPVPSIFPAGGRVLRDLSGIDFLTAAESGGQINFFEELAAETAE